MKERLSEAEFHFMNIIWDKEPIGSGELVKICKEKFNWQKSTSYTVLKNVARKGYCQNIKFVVTSTVPREVAQKKETSVFMEKTFKGSLPNFLVAFFDGKKISEKEAEDLKKMIDDHKE